MPIYKKKQLMLFILWWGSVGSYSTRNIVVIESWFLERPTESCIDLDLSKFYSSGDPPFRGGFA